MPRFRSLRPLSEPSKRLSERESITELALCDAQHAAPGTIFGRSPLLKTHSLRIPRRTRQRLTSHDFIESAPAQRSSPCPSRIRRGTSDKDLAYLGHNPSKTPKLPRAVQIPATSTQSQVEDLSSGLKRLRWEEATSSGTRGPFFSQRRIGPKV